jgi:thioredoxin 1
MSKPVPVTDSSFDAEVLKADIPVLTDFGAEWSGPCQAMAPIVEQLAAEYEGQIKVAQLDIDANPQVSAHYMVLSIPTLLLFKNGQPVERLVGTMPRQKLLDKLRPHLR